MESNHAGFTGSGFVNYDNVTGSYVEWTVDAAQAGAATLTLRYANGTTANRPMDITVNGTVAATAWPSPAPAPGPPGPTTTVTATLNAGANTVRVTATTANGGPNVDQLTVGTRAATAARRQTPGRDQRPAARSAAPSSATSTASRSSCAA